jgi:predicted metal-dependent hydrolase
LSNAGKKGKRKTRIAPPKISPDLGHRYIFRVSPRPFVKTGGLITVALRVLAPHSRHRKIITQTLKKKKNWIQRQVGKEKKRILNT